MKTISLKKVAVVAVASLGFGLLSVVPANAGAGACTAWTEYAGSKVTAMNLVARTANTNVQNTEIKINFGATASDFIASANDAATCHAQKFVGYISSYPANGYAAVTTEAAGTPLAFTGANATDATASALTVQQTTSATKVTGAAKTATAASGLGTFKFTPSKAGTYVLTVFNDVGTGAGSATLNNLPDATEFVQSITITVTAASGYSPSLSTILMGTGATPATTTTDLLPVSSLKTAGNGQAANIRVAVKNSSGAAYAGQGVTATVSGPGLIMCVSQAAADTAEANATGTVRSITVADTTGFVSCRLDPDGTAGTSTVTISVTDQVSGATTTLGSKSVTFYGSVAKIVATANYTILKAGGGVTGGSTAGVVATNYLDLSNRINATDVPAVIVKATDSVGNVVGGLTILGLSSDTTVANSWTGAGADDTNGCKEDVLSAANEYSSGGTGFYNCALSTPTTATSGKSATITFRILDPSDPLGVAYLTSVVTVTTGGTTPGTETITFDKTSYAPGEAMNVTRTCKDTSGNPCADGTAAPAITFSKAVGGTAPGASTYTAGKKSSTSSTGVATVFAPVIGGAFSANATSGNAAGSAITASASVTDANAGLLTQIDALNAKIVALNALIAKIMKKLGVK